MSENKTRTRHTVLTSISCDFYQSPRPMGGNDICKCCQLGVKEGGMGGVGGGWFCQCTVGHGEEERRRSSISPFVFPVLCASATAPQRLIISRSSQLNSGKGGKTKKRTTPKEPQELGYRTTSSASATHLPNKQTNKILPLPLPSSHHRQTSLCRFCFCLLSF